MMTGGDANPTVELALSELRRSVDVGLTEIRGQLALLLQRSEQAERRADQQAKELEDLESRLGKVERDAVTRADLEKRSGRTIAILSIIVAAVGVLSSIGTATITAIVN